MSKITSSIIFILLPLTLIAVEDPKQPEIRPFQLSLVPFISTEGVYAQEHIYNISLNIFAGLTGGVEGIELGGFLNMNRFTMTGIQAAGFGNMAEQAEGVQAAGFGNTARQAEGVQAAGFMNIARDMEGIQASGFLNIARNIEGVQAAGFINVASKVQGLQIGFINIADTVVGLPVGFLSIVRDGYRKLELSAGDAMNLNLGFKIGVRHFYNIFTTGFQFTYDDPVFSYGYGLGTEINLPERRYLNIEILTHQLMKGRWWDYEDLNLLGQLRVTYAMDLSDRWQFFAGPVANIHITRSNANDTLDLAHYEMFRFTGRNTENVVWLGINAGFRFW